jgi:hypothetical protein
MLSTDTASPEAARQCPTWLGVMIRDVSRR